MTTQIDTILYPTDLSDHGRITFDHAATIANAMKARIVVLHVVEPLTKHASAVIDGFLPEGSDDTQTMHKKQVEKLREDLSVRMQQMAQELSGAAENSSPIAEIRVVEGFSAATILSQAAEVNANLIVMGTHGLSALGEMLLGSVAHKVVHQARIPVMLVPFKQG